MTDQNAAQQRVQIDPLAAYTEAQALNEFYKNRCLLLGNECAMLRSQLESMRAELEQRDNDLQAMQEMTNGNPS